MNPLLLIFLLATFSFLFAFTVTPILTHFLYKYRAKKIIRDESETPIFSKLHQKKAGTPTMGGILIWGTVLIIIIVLYVVKIVFPESSLAQFSFFSRQETYLPLGALIASALVGLVDDIFNIKQKGAHGGGLRVRHRLIIFACIALVGAWWFYTKLDWTTIHVPFVGNFDIGIWYIPLFFFTIIATSFSVNESDGLDGLAGGILLSGFAAFAAIALMQGKYDLATFCAVIIGALLAFLWYNITPARFFMGDTGSMSLGVTLGIVAMLTNSVFLLPIIGFLLVLESLSVILQIIWKKFFKKKLFLSAPFHHHLEAIGWSESKIVMRLWIIAGVSAVVGVIFAIIDFSQLYG
ncbi:MAG: phospho-N-acetylmuramoyl-pentapeptide-transferase [Patescibacteria group bacterium]|jgi:phospho-N-acetylmuramoyl-pentapeptide-transferase